jgi:hypothetical protein
MSFRSTLLVLGAFAAMFPGLAQAQQLFAVDRLALGAVVDADSLMRQSYACKPSEDYPGFTWCKHTQNEQRATGPLSISSTIVLAGDGTVVYVNKDVFPAFFNDRDVGNEIDRLSVKFKLRPRFLPAVKRPGKPTAVMASWGGVDFIPLEPDKREAIAQGLPAHAGILAAQTGTFMESVREGLPIYRLAGKAGFFYLAGFDANGQGALRIFAIDPSRLAAAKTAPSAIAVAEVERARAEADKAKADAEKARAEAEKAIAEAQKLKAEAEIAKLNADRAKPQEAPQGKVASPKVLDADNDPDVRRALEEEERFITAIVSNRNAFVAAQDETAQRGARDTRKSAICAALPPSLSVRQWQGTIALLDGKGALSIRLVPDLELRTWSDAGSSSGDTSLFDPNSSLSKKLASLKEGDFVSFSGSFLRSDADCVKETNLMIARSMRQPEFVFRFADVSRR